MPVTSARTNEGVAAIDAPAQTQLSSAYSARKCGGMPRAGSYCADQKPQLLALLQKFQPGKAKIKAAADATSAEAPACTGVRCS